VGGPWSRGNQEESSSSIAADSALSNRRTPTQEVILMCRRCLAAGDAWQLGLEIGELPRCGCRKQAK
jgi:hypothetical protein